MEAFGPEWLAFGSVLGGETPTASLVGSLGLPLLQPSLSTMWQQQVSSMQRPRRTSQPHMTKRPVPLLEQAQLSQVMFMILGRTGILRRALKRMQTHLCSGL